MNNNNIDNWLKSMGWSSNPFTFNINPSLFVGYIDQTKKIMMTLQEKHKFIMLIGPTGSGKTTLLKWLQENTPAFETIYIPKPPQKPEEFISIFNNRFSRGFFRRFIPNIKNIYQIPDFLNKKLKHKHLILLCDEIHEADADILEWLRVLTDHIENMSILLSGLPVFENQLKEKLETLRKRIIIKIGLLSLTKEETEELIKKRINSVGGSGDEFLSVFDAIYERTAGFPREVIRLCNELVNKAILLNKNTITPDLLEIKEEKKEPISLDIIDKLTRMQKNILEMLSKGHMSSGDIANNLQLENYKTRQHAVRSVNNILRRLMEEGLIEREVIDRVYVYHLTPKIKTMIVKT